MEPTKPVAPPAAEQIVDAPRLRTLLAAQHPDLARLPIEPVGAGWDNWVFRLGGELAARLPRRQLAVALLENEQRWLPQLARQLPLAVPEPVRVGRPVADYPWPWTVYRWIPGRPLEQGVADTDVDTVAAQLGEFLRCLHRPAPPEAPTNPFRGGPLNRYRDRFVARLEAVGVHVEIEPACRVWRQACDSAWDAAPCWLHGDFHARNVLFDGGRISGVVDFGDLTAGDPATDLSAAFTVLPERGRRVLREVYGPIDDDTWARARGWALYFGVTYLASSADDPSLADMGRQAVAGALDG